LNNTPDFIPEDLRRLLVKLDHLKQGNTSYGPAPHKPILLLSLIDYLESKGLTINEFPLDDHLLLLFETNWKLLVTTKHVCNITKPLFHLQTDKIWTLSTHLSPSEVENKSYKTLSTIAPLGLLAPEIFSNILHAETREIIRIALLNRYFPSTETLYYQQNGAVPELIAADESILEEPLVGYSKKKISIRIYEGYIRDLRFRHQVLRIYKNTCAMSGYSILGAPLIEACHISMHALSGDNNIQNGIALSRNLHTAFDFGLIGLDDDYHILLNPNKELHESDDHHYALSKLKNKPILLPDNRKFYPSLEYVRQHRAFHNF
jgi:putative restriction endonuclease